MPPLERPDGVEVHWEARGDGGPLVLLVHHFWSLPEIYDRLLANLAQDHRVVVFDPRGFGKSTRRGPYDLETDTADMLAVAREAGGDAVALAVGSGFNRAARGAVEQPDLVAHVVAIAPAAAAFLPREELRDSGAMAASESVADMLLQMLQTDSRAALRSMLAAANPELSEEELRDRVERSTDYLSADAALERARAWLGDDVSEQARALGDRLWLLGAQQGVLYEGVSASRARERFSHAHFVDIGEGPVSQPDLIASTVRRVTAGRGAADPGPTGG